MEVTNLQKEVQSKHDLLCQAVKAMELEEEEHKKSLCSKEEQLNMCQRELEDLRLQLQVCCIVSINVLYILHQQIDSIVKIVTQCIK